MLRKSAIILFSFLCFGIVAQETTEGRAQPRIIPLEDFFRNPQQAGFQLSPDGRYLASLRPWEKRLNVYVQKIGEKEAKRVTDSVQRDILWYLWASNDRIVYFQDEGGDENFKLYAVGKDGSGAKDLTPFEKARVTLIDELENDDVEMLIGINKRDPRVFDAYRINILTGELKMIAENPGNIVGWMTDHDGKLRLASTTDGVNTGILYRDTEEEPLRPLVSTNFKETLRPVCFTYDNRNLYVISNIKEDKAGLCEYDVAKKELKEAIYRHPEVDIASVHSSDKRKKLIGVSFFTSKRQYHFLDDEARDLQKNLEKRLPGYEVVVTNMSRDETRLIVRTYSDKSLGTSYYYDRAQDDLQKLEDLSPWIDESEMADMQPIAYKSRDGLTIHGYLTLPPGCAPKKLPVVVNPHGGPWHRDYWRFNAEAQFLANRGYAVLQMNFRGSTGYGRAFWEASFKKWGREMQDDITDGVKWLIDLGIADPKRVGIYGGSYGGYATLAGLAFTPDLYACGVDYVGVANIFTLFASIPPYWEPMRQMFYEMVGDPEKDKELLRAASPVFHADKIKAPLFIAQGANDPRVKKAESDQMVAALKERGVEVPYLVKDNEGHGFANEENRFEFYRAMEEFLARHLGGRKESK